MTKPDESKPERLLRREQAAKYVVETYNVPCTRNTLAKLACVSSEGPPFRLAGRFPLYPIPGLDAWAQSKIGPLVRSTSEVQSVAQTKTAVNAESGLGHQGADLDAETA
jgi:hypothetical protein